MKAVQGSPVLKRDYEENILKINLSILASINIKEIKVKKEREDTPTPEIVSSGDEKVSIS